MSQGDPPSSSDQTQPAGPDTAGSEAAGPEGEPRQPGEAQESQERQSPQGPQAGPAEPKSQGRDPMGPQPEVQPDRQAMAVDAEQPPRLAFPVVGVGASAGGLEAFIEFVTAMPSDSGMAFVFIQHLPPERESLLADILSKKTRMVVRQVEDGMAVEPDHLYVIRPGHVLTIKDGRLHLGPQLGKRGANRPVDDFFKSLAEEQRERAIGVILSGMGSNGTAGAQAIKAVGGICVAQDPDTARFPSMPRHLIDQGYADYVLAPGNMPEMLLGYAGHPYAREGRHDADDQIRRNRNHLRDILAILRTRTRQDFSGYKKPTLLRRVQRRMGLARQTDMGEYALVLRQSTNEVQALADDLLIHVTGFFRDPDAWEALRQKVVVPLVARREPDGEVRAWVTACSSGEEAYTLAMMLLEEAERADKPLGIKVFATDMAERTLEHARAGVYPDGIESEIDPERLEKFFQKDDGLYHVKPNLRECVVFAPQNVLSDPPFSRLDIVTCRNLLIYLEPQLQQRVLLLLHFGLREGGVLFLGGSETVWDVDGLYEVMDKRARIFRRVGPTRHGQLDFPLARALRDREGAGGGAAAAAAAAEQQSVERRGSGRPSIGLMTQRTLLEQHVKAAVTIDRDNQVLYFHGNTGPFLEQPAGEPTRDLLVLAREGLRGAVRVAVHRCAAEQAAVTVLDGWVETAPGRLSRVSVTASGVSSDDPAHPEYFVVSFDHLDDLRPGDAPAAGDGDAGSAEEELRRVRDELQTTIEEVQTSNEELRAANEEVTSINEELQSSNEELETSKEEMQSLNEELTTLNAQLRETMEQQQNASNDLTALLASTDIAVLFLDTNFRIRRYTPAVKDLLDVIPGDVGRPLTDLNCKFDDPHLDDDVRGVLERLVPVERLVSATDGRHYQRRVLPYRTLDNRIDGVVVTFVDVSERQHAERELAEAKEYAESIVQTLHEPLLVLNTDLTVRGANPAFYRHFNVDERRTVGRRIYDLGNGQWDIPALRRALEEVLPDDKVFTGYEVDHEFEGLGRRVMLLNGRRLDHVQLILLGVRDVTDERELRAASRERESRLRGMLDLVPDLLWSGRPDGSADWHNRRWTEYTGLAPEQSVGWGWRDAVHPDDREAAERGHREAVEAGRSFQAELRIRRRDGQYRWFLVRAEPVRDGAGAVTVFGSAADVHEQRAAMEALRAGDEQFRLVFEGARDFAMLMLDADNKITAWNVGAERVTGFGRDEVVGRDGAILFTPEDREAGAVEKERAEAAASGSAADERWHLRKDGSRFWGSGVMTALRNRDGSLRGYVKVLRDETARKHVEEALQSAKESAELANRAKDQFLATLSHEMRTPMAAMLIWAKMLRTGKAGPEQMKEGLEAIARAAEAQEQLIEDLLDTSRITSGKLRLQPREAKLVATVAEAADAILPAAEAKGVVVAAELDRSVGVVHTDPDRLRQVVWNLLSNAVKFTPEGGRVDLTMARRGNTVEIRVADTGQGIEPEFLPHVFEPFRQADASSTRRHGGLGLGLAIARQLVELHGGTIAAESAGAGKGATFTVRLPLPRVRPRDTADAAGAAGAAAPAAGPALAGARVLLVEDELETRNALVVLLIGAGAQVTTVNSADAALKAFEKSRPDVLLSDIGLPGTDGFELLRQIRQREQAEHAGQAGQGGADAKIAPIPAVALTAFARDQDRQAARDAGFAHYLTKPADPEELLTVLGQAVAKRKRRGGK